MMLEDLFHYIPLLRYCTSFILHTYLVRTYPRPTTLSRVWTVGEIETTHTTQVDSYAAKPQSMWNLT